MLLTEFPPELLLSLPRYLRSIEDLLSLSSTCRTLYRTCAEPDPKIIPGLVAASGRIFFRPHPHFVIAATARQLGDWAVKHDDHRYLLEVAIQGGVEKLLELAIDVAELTMEDIRKLHAFKSDVINPLNRRLDVASGPASGDPWTVCNDPETTLLSWVIYGELFHHSFELAYSPLPEHKPLSSVTRYKWFVYCMPDVNSFNYMEFEDQPPFFKEYDQKKDDRFQQLSMSQAMREMLNRLLWEHELQSTPSFQEIPGASREEFIRIVMHMGMKSLAILVPGGPERLREDLDRIAKGIIALEVGGGGDDTSLLKFVDDRWLGAPRFTLETDVGFSLWANWMGEDEDEDDSKLLMEAIRSPPQRKVPVE
ncbi:hypothetical protein DFH07DRAFT_860517 [Mycena maculata]|uniref:F-box domain-containing protein n=1 Tax=Mycena maculata TaxID=230809 RepID=A0AAD7HD91_9AGAR|nr:hypothetical protein DFH07DRAFT_860517 [Mycena maculata]